MWFKSHGYDDSELKKKISSLELEVEKIKGHMISLRGFVNRKMQDSFDDEEEEKPDNPQDRVLAKTYK